nr:hypothetical protein [Hoylesella enoeca]
MKLHIFNPEHDMALAADNPHFTPPHTARELRSDLGFLPVLWADDGDLVLVENISAALNAVRHLKCHTADVLFVTSSDLSIASSCKLEIAPWGWDSALKQQLTAINPELKKQTPPHETLAQIRQLSNRRWAGEQILPHLIPTDERLIGTSEYITDIQILYARICQLRHAVLKAPWSSSGRGLRYVEPQSDQLEPHLKGWAVNTIKRQGGLMIEPFYNKIRDFGMEFLCTHGSVTYQGLSLFKTTNGSYTGSIIATESEKQKILSQHIPTSLLDTVRNTITRLLTNQLVPAYNGPLGIDMMIVSHNGQFKLHPCVELNLRRTMGHVALSVAHNDTTPQRLMTISHTDKYHLRIIETGENLLPITWL